MYYVLVVFCFSFFNFIKYIFRDETCPKEIEISDSPEVEARKKELEARKLERELEAKVLSFSFILLYSE